MDPDDITPNRNDVDITEGEIVEVETTRTAGDAAVVMNLESLIKSHMSNAGRLQEEAKKFKEMLDDIFKNDPTYQEHTKIAEEAAKVKKATKAQILKRPQAAELDSKVKSLKSELKETQGALSDYLREFQRMSGLNEIENDKGEVMSIVYTAKLVKTGSKNMR